ncbi:MAG: hypothetical protein E7317_02785 [Clostridiales bacterium]|nr:hypothetical protein [Clostridiales bacterium]
MKNIDIRFDATTMETLQELIGKKLVKYKCDPFFSPSAFGIVGLYTEQGIFALTNDIRVMDHFGSDEDVAVLELNASTEREIHSWIDNITMVETPVGTSVKEIRVINENQRLYRGGEQIYDVWLTRGIIFVMNDRLEIAFEKQVWFSEMISVSKGYHLYQQFSPVNEFSENWEYPFTGECERQVITLS